MPTNISWTDETWNPTTGCSVVSDGCTNCYAEALSLRMSWSKKPWTAINAAENVVLHPERLTLPARWKAPRRIFVNSMSDLFHEQIPDEFIERVFWAMAETPRHTFQVLTKRPARMRQFLQTHDHLFWKLAPIWLGTSVEDQRRADERIPELLAIPWPHRFLSCEPLLGEVDLSAPRYRLPEGGLGSAFNWGRGIDWVIDGGESGPGFRPANPDWYRLIRDTCVAVGVPYFHKQGSGRRPGTGVELDGRVWHQFPEVKQ